MHRQRFTLTVLVSIAQAAGKPESGGKFECNTVLP